jgi:tetratricopeptide (TPR) repeat protein
VIAVTSQYRPGFNVDQFRAELRSAAALMQQNPALGRRALIALSAEPVDDAAALRFLGRCLRQIGEAAAAEIIENRAIDASSRTEPISGAIRNLLLGRLPQAERVVREHLERASDDVAALCVLADIATRSGVLDQAELLLRDACHLAPGFAEARLNLARLLARRGKANEGISLLEAARGDLAAGLLKLTLLGHIGDYDKALHWAETMIAASRTEPALWSAYGHLLKTMGRPVECEAAFRHSLSLDPKATENWWGLADLKGGVLDSDDIGAMRQQLKATTTVGGDSYLWFALGRALEDSGNLGEAFAAYEQGNALKRCDEPYRAATTLGEVDGAVALFTPDFFAARRGWGHPSAEPIFVVGMPRAGSTLVEQILASHSQIEGTSELPGMPIIAHQISLRFRHQPALGYPGHIAELTAKDCHALGNDYLALCAPHRHTSRFHFIDKLPNNWLNIGLIKLILPNAKIIDARRDPYPCCFSNYKQLFAVGQEYSYSISDLVFYYYQYLRLMEKVAPLGPIAIHRVDHEALVGAPQREISAMLDYIEVDFETACFTPEQNRRAVRTASAQQVRRPINADGLTAWHGFRPYLAELEAALQAKGASPS